MTVTKAEPRCRRCGADATRSHGRFEHVLELGRAPDVISQLLRLCGPCSRDLDTDERRLEYLRLGVLA